jgi:hypothetical protein
MLLHILQATLCWLIYHPFEEGYSWEVVGTGLFHLDYDWCVYNFNDWVGLI